MRANEYHNARHANFKYRERMLPARLRLTQEERKAQAAKEIAEHERKYADRTG